MNKLPLARSANIVVQKTGNEILIYNLVTNKAYNLNETSSMVYQSCDGNTSFEELRLKSKFTDEIIFLALDELRKENLIEDISYSSPFVGMNRREVIRKVGLASMITLPIITILITPTAAQAQSCQALGNSCNFNNGTQSDCCDANARCTNNGTIACRPCLTTGVNTNCNTGAGCCTSQLSFFSNSCCNGVTESPIVDFPGQFSCSCN